MIEGPAPGERQISALAIAAAVALFTILLLVVPPYFVTFDEAKYLGIGASLWAGRGPETTFGIAFLSHSPLWSLLLFAPQALIGASALDWGHTLNEISGVIVLLVSGLLGWRIRPAVGAIAVAALLGVFYLHDLTRTARLDIPAAAVALTYVWIGLRSVERGSVRLAALAGVVFAIGFLIKEISLPFAPVPLIVGILAGRPWSVLSRTAAATLATAAIGTSWWFVEYANDAGRVYRLDAPVWTLIPIGLVFAVSVVVGLVCPRFAERPRAVALRARAAQRVPWIDRHGRVAAGWGSLALWFLAQLVLYGKTARLQGAPIVDVDQLALYARQWLVGPLWLGAAAGLIGIVLSLGARWAARGTARARAMDVVIVAVIAGLPLVLLVIGVGEPPRNYIAQIGLMGALAATGWLWAAESVVARVAAAAGGAPARARATIVALAVVGALVGGSGILGIHVRANATSPAGIARGEAVRSAIDWVNDNAPPGSTIAFGSFLSYEMSYDLTSAYRTFQVRHRISIINPSAPLGLFRAKDVPGDDWIAVDTAPRNVREFQAFRATWLTAALTGRHVAYWIYATGVPTSAPTILAQLTPDHGFERVAGWSYPVTNEPPIEVAIFKVDLARLSFDTGALYAAPDALERMVTLLDEQPEKGSAIAGRLAKIIRVVPDGPAALAAKARLDALAGR